MLSDVVNVMDGIPTRQSVVELLESYWSCTPPGKWIIFHYTCDMNIVKAL